MRNNPEYDSLSQSQLAYDLGNNTQFSTLPTKITLQNTYKNQLDDLVEYKRRMKQQQKIKNQQQRKKYNERLKYGVETQKMKQASYRNYYTMLLNNQQQVQDQYISPFAYSDNKKKELIKNTTQQGQRRMEFLSKQRQRIDLQRKNNYKRQLINQMKEKQLRNMYGKQQYIQGQQQYRRHLKLPEQIKKMERQKHHLEMIKYKQDLDKVRENKSMIETTKKFSSDTNTIASEFRHNAIMNPMPYNIQNPYILKQISRQHSLNYGNDQQSRTIDHLSNKFN